MFSVHAASQGAGQMRPVNSGKLLVECSVSDAHCASCRGTTRSFQSGMMLLTGQPFLTERDAAVHAARALLLRLLVGQVQHELTVVPDARPAASEASCSRSSSRNPVTSILGSL
jgi:hypothetical protein